jgi:predicted nuclease with TOPRIM domain
LRNRIGELFSEIEDSRENFKLLHKERLHLLKERDAKSGETENWKQKCKDLQMLKFGREIDLDELEAFSDRTKELEIEGILQADRMKFEKESLELSKEVNNAKEKLISVRSQLVSLFLVNGLLT